MLANQQPFCMGSQLNLVSRESNSLSYQIFLTLIISEKHLKIQLDVLFLLVHVFICRTEEESSTHVIMIVTINRFNCYY